MLLAEADAAFPPDLWAAFLVLEVFVNQATDGSIDLYVKSLGCDDPDVTKKLSGIFNRREGYLHLCMSVPCPVSDGNYLHVTRFRQYSLEGFDREYLTAHMRSPMKKWMEESGETAEEEEAPPGEEAAALPGLWDPVENEEKERKPGERLGGAPKRKADKGANHPERLDEPPKPRPGALRAPGSRMTEKDREGLRRRLDMAKDRILGASERRGLGHGTAGQEAVRDPEDSEVLSVKSSEGYSPSPLEEKLTTGTTLEDTQRSLRRRPSRSKRPRKREEPRRERSRTRKDGDHARSSQQLLAQRALQLEDTKGSSSNNLQKQLVLRAAGNSRRRAAEKEHQKEKSKDTGAELVRILTKAMKSQKHGQDAKKKKKKKRKRKLKREPGGDPSGSSKGSPTSSYYDDSESGQESSSEVEKKNKYEPPLKRRAMHRPGSVLRMLVDHARSHLDQSSKVALDKNDTGDMTQGIKIASYFSVILKPQMGGNTAITRELHHLANAIDMLRAGTLDSLGDLMASRFMALHQASLDGGWSAARHMELLPLEEVSAAGTGVVLEARRHARMAARAQSQENFNWKGSNRSKGGRGKGSWQEDWQTGSKGQQGKGGKGRGKGKGWWKSQSTEGDAEANKKREKAPEK